MDASEAECVLYICFCRQKERGREGGREGGKEGGKDGRWLSV